MEPDVAMGDKMNVLILDDDQLVLNNLSRLLRANGHKVETALDPGKMFGLISTLENPECIDVLVCDYDLGYNTIRGNVFCRTIKNKIPSIRCILFTGEFEPPHDHWIESVRCKTDIDGLINDIERKKNENV